MELARVVLRWDGTRLSCEPVFGPQWHIVTGYGAPQVLREGLHMESVEDVTPFELGMLLMGSATQLTDEWSAARQLLQMQGRQLELFPDTFDERPARGAHRAKR